MLKSVYTVKECSHCVMPCVVVVNLLFLKSWVYLAHQTGVVFDRLYL